jgi:DNA-binding NarL/FixJ family response regulator
MMMSNSPPVCPPTVDVPDAHGALTAREREVVALLVGGLTNRAIAQTLCIAAPTAERHVANLLKKLGMHSRTEVAVWAITHQIVVTRTPRFGAD